MSAASITRSPSERDSVVLDYSSSLYVGRGDYFAHRFSAQFDAVKVRCKAVKKSVSDRRVTNACVPVGNSGVVR